MKPFIHPKRNSTLIQRKDGRTYVKNWVYFRSILRSDNDEKVWTLPNAFTDEVKQEKAFKVSTIEKKNRLPNNHYRIAYFYISIECLHMLNFLPLLQIRD